LGLFAPDSHWFMAERITDATGKEFVDLASHERVVAELADVRLAYVEAMERENAQEQQQQRAINPVVGSSMPMTSFAFLEKSRENKPTPQ